MPPTRRSSIRQYGSTRSINAAAAAAIVMHAWIAQHAPASRRRYFGATSCFAAELEQHDRRR